MQLRGVLYGVLGVVSLLAASCGPSSTDLNVVRSATEKHYERLRENRFAEIYNSAAPAFRKNADLESWTLNRRIVVERWGPLEKMEILTCRPELFVAGPVRVVVRTTYAKGTFQERLVWEVDNGVARLEAELVEDLWTKTPPTR